MLPEEKKRELEAKYGDRLYYIIAGEYEFAVVSPTQDQSRRFFKLAHDPEQKHEAAQTLFGDCVVAPDRTEIAQILNKKPFYEVMIGNRMGEIAGASDAIVVKKALP